MTTVVFWKVQSPLSLDMKVGGINVIADSRVSNGSSVLTNNCAKIFEVPVHCQITDDEVTFQDRVDHYTNIVVGISGSTLIAQNTVFCLQQTLCRLVGTEMPSIVDIATFAASVLTNLSKEVGIITPKTAYSEIVIVGMNGNETQAYSIRPNDEGPLEYYYTKIDAFPYAMGSGAKVFNREYDKVNLDEISDNSLEQLPIRIFDEHLIQSESDPHTGGELQMLTISGEGVSRFIPMRWNEAEFNYKRELFGQNILEKAIGNSRIASSTWILDDC